MQPCGICDNYANSVKLPCGRVTGDMEKTVPAFEARRRFGRLLQDVLARGDRFVVERHGQPVAAVVPIEVYEQWQKARQTLLSRIRAASERASLSPEEADELAAEAVRAVRGIPPQ